jgi:hypothetical protein
LRLAKNGLFFPLPIEAENCYDPFQLPNRWNVNTSLTFGLVV